METEIKQQAGDKLILILAFTMVIAVMSATMFNIVLPEISADFQLSFAQVSWVSSAYMLIYAIGSVTYGKLADRYPLKNLLTFGLIFFALGSIIGLAAHAYWMVLAGRILQSMGASVIPATAMIIPVRYFPPERRGRAFGITATALAIGSALGPIVSSFVVSFVHWRWLFFVPLFTLFTLPFYRKHLIEESRKGGTIDWLGGGLLAGMVVLFLLAVTNGVWLLAVGGLIMFLLFLVRIQTAADPFVQPRLFRNKRYSFGLMIAFLAAGTGFSIPFLSPLLLADVNHLDVGIVGFAMVPAATAAAILGRYGGKLADVKGNSFLFYTASALLLIGFASLSTFAGVAPVVIAVLLIFCYVGQTFMQITLSNAISRTLPAEQTGVGMGLLSLLNFIAGAASAGVYSKVVDLGSSIHWNPINGYPEAFVFSNIYLVLAAMYVGILLLYYFQFGRVQQTDSQGV
ncbi:MFS transporter [Desmospora activa]|uniref:DHA2 family metal-tetracycline-proton antiporter-like MFS transporter n=1 Tax=Desmospora activa DSM 45169 TaxID=1121389 RepID=A0A2T4ZA14_9BACL|nr:MFS transporter [Desmospora activa]PTM58713.1 DHA2 family metal-tetracycline-proton antiporter-like MFS transporter [Desmospora activa DSM 45169]